MLELAQVFCWMSVRIVERGTSIRFVFLIYFLVHTTEQHLEPHA